MGQSVTLDETISIDRPVREVFAYVSEFSRIEQWDPAVFRAVRLTEGAPGLGSEYRIQMKAGFSLNYRVIEFEPGERMLMQVESRHFTAEEEILFNSVGDKTELRYIANFEFRTALGVFNRLFPGAMDRVGKAAMAGLQKALDDQYATPEASKIIATGDKLVLPGIWRFTRLGYQTARNRWNAVSAYQGDRHAVITGATSGIGEAAARQLAEMGAKLTLVVRNKEKAESLVARLVDQTGNERIGYEIADLAIMADVHSLCDRLLAAGEPVDMLINNAGALFNPRQQTPEGLEKSFALLLLSPYILTERLYPLLSRSGDARVVNVLSGGMYSQKIRVNDLQSERGKYSGSVAYARAKRGLMIATEEWAERWQNDAIAVNAMHPGWADTPGVESALPDFYRITRRWLRSPDEGADTTVWLATSTEAGRISGKFWLDREQHPSHLSDRTKETPEEREHLLSTLSDLLDSTSGHGEEPREAAS
jgi:NAD(P)-dependent dehydrogenase (short-subunit alcohol dehydrogenase family)/uncharacterized protein YndB with AHSA1/START domain